jgi:hypothetical protein
MTEDKPTTIEARGKSPSRSVIGGNHNNGGEQSLPPWASIEAALRDLQTPKSSTVGAIPYGSTVPSIARNLWLIGRGKDGQQSQFTTATITTTENELAQFSKKIEALCRVIDTMHAPAFSAFSPDALMSLRNTLYGFAIIAKHHKPAMRQEFAPKKGKPPSIVSRNLSRECATEFYRLTGSRPTLTKSPITNRLGGRFFRFLVAVFLACDRPSKNGHPTNIENIAEEAVSWFRGNIRG